jgi:capsular exopolysaccharide synthesis family protein
MDSHTRLLRTPLAEARLTVPSRPRPTVEIDQTSETTLFRSWQLLANNKIRILAMALFGAMVGVLFDAIKVVTYDATSLIEVMSQGEQTGMIRAVNTQTIDEPSWVETQVAVLKSQSTSERVSARRKSAPPSDIREVRPLWNWARTLGIKVKPNPDSLGRALAMARKTLKTEQVGHTRVVAITCSSTSPEIAARFVNSLVEDFMAESQRAQIVAGEEAQLWLKQQIGELKRRLEEGDRELQRYAQMAGLFTDPSQSLPGLQTLHGLEQELAAARANRIAKDSRLNLLSSVPQESLSLFAEDATLKAHEAQLNDLRRQMADLRTSFTPEHYRVQRLDAQIKQLESVVASERAGMLLRARRDYEEASGREGLLTGTISRQSGIVSNNAVRQINMQQLRRELDITRQLHDGMLQKLNEVTVTSAVRPHVAWVIDAAKPGGVQDPPFPIRNLILGSLAGMGLCAGFLLVLDGLNTNVRGPGEVPLYLNVPEFGVIPSAKVDPDWQQIRGTTSSLLQTASDDKAVELVSWNRKPSMMAESFRRTLASILFAHPNGARPKILVVTSPGPGEGKSTVVCNIGTALAEIHHRVLLIDADMRNSQLHRVFDVPNTWGLTDLLLRSEPIDNLPLEALAKPTRIPNLYVLPSGPSTLSISHLLFAEPMRELLRRVAREFDTVLIDTPPALMFADCRILGRLSDGVILVLRAGHSKRADAIAAVRRLAEDNTGVLGTVLNDWVPGREDRPYSYYRTTYRTPA